LPKNSPFPGFPPHGLTFLRALRRHNHREWFLSHKEEYEHNVREPMIALVLALGEQLRQMAPELWTDPARAIYRIYRDIRFSPDKTPYKTHIAALFSVEGLPKHACGSLYFHISPESVEIAGGVYLPGPAELLTIRNHIAANHAEMRRILADRKFKTLFGGLWGQQLTRVPKGFTADHPAEDLLRYKQWLVDVEHPAKLALEPRLYLVLVEAFRAMIPLVRFLNTPLCEGIGNRELKAC
jgi:uncharacterized protein (TIGR02453 family)